MAFAEPQPGLVPLGGNFYATPNEPQEPQWDRPFSPTFIGMEKRLTLDSCNIGIEVTGVLGFMRLPAFQLLYRNPDCIPPKPEFKNFVFEEEKNDFKGVNNGILIAVFSDFNYYSSRVVEVLSPGQVLNSVSETLNNQKSKVDSFVLDDSYLLTLVNGYKVKNTHKLVLKTTTIRQITGQQATTTEGTATFYLHKDFPDITEAITEGENLAPSIWNKSKVNALDFISSLPNVYVDTDTSLNTAGFLVRQKIRRSRTFLFLGESPPPPPPPKKPMTCCPQNDQLLRLILKRIGNLPVTVPNTLLTENEVQPQFNKRIESLASYMTWHYERLDELMGEWESSAKIKGGKNDKGEDIEAVVRLPNLAEAVSEIFALTMQNYTRVDTILNIVTRILLESAAIKQQDFKSYKAIMAMVDWMNFDHKDEVLEMPLTCDPSKGSSFNNLLKESDVKVSVMNATDKHTLNETLHNLMFAASIIKGTFLKKTGDEISDIFPNVKNELDKLSGNIDKDEVQKFVNELLKKNDT